MKNPERALATLVGEVHALYMAIQVLAKTNVNPQLASSELDVAEQRGLAAFKPPSNTRRNHCRISGCGCRHSTSPRGKSPV